MPASFLPPTYISLGHLTYDGIIALRQAVIDSQEGLDYYNKLAQIAADTGACSAEEVKIVEIKPN